MSDDDRAGSGDERKERRDRSRDRSRRKKRKSRSRSPRKERSRSRDRERSRGGDRGGSRERERRSHSRSRRQSRSKSPVEDPAAVAARRAQEEERERNKSDYTVFVCQIHPKVDERDLFEFFSHVGRVEDIRLIRDQRTQRSKGLCYVEFWEKESVHKAVALTGQLIGGYPIQVQVTQSEKTADEVAGSTMRLYVSQLHQNVTENDLKPVFEAFGPLDFIDLHNDPNTGESKGFGYVQYKSDADAKAALASLNGLEIAGKQIAVGVVDQDTQKIAGLGELDQDGDAGMAMTAQGRHLLMQKLQRGTAIPGLPSLGGAPPPMAAHQQQYQPAHIGVPRIQSTTCVVVKNMFDPRTESDPEFHLDIEEDVREEAEKYGRLRHILVDKNSAGCVFLRFDEVHAAEKIVKAFHGRWFASRQISAEFIIESTYQMKFPKS